MSNNYVVEYLIDNVAFSVSVKANSPDKALDVAFDSLTKMLNPEMFVPQAIALRNTDAIETIQDMVKYGLPGTL